MLSLTELFDLEDRALHIWCSGSDRLIYSVYGKNATGKNITGKNVSA